MEKNYDNYFFGHNKTPQSVQPLLQKVLIDLIENHGATFFYVGNHGGFDSMVRKNLKLLKLDYPHIKYTVVLAYMPKHHNDYEDYSDTIYPDGLENTPPKYAIPKRNRWMINKSDIVITYIDHNFGGAAKYKELAEKKGKIVINLANLE